MKNRLSIVRHLPAAALSLVLSCHSSLAGEEVKEPTITTEYKKDADGNDVPYMYIDGIKVHEEDPLKQPYPPVVSPGKRDGPVTAPSDAIVLFDGSNKSFKENWTDKDGAPSGWRVVNGTLESVQNAGFIFTRKAFGSCQLHFDWAAPIPAKGEGQHRGNSGVFIMGNYELQILDSYNNPTYADGQAGALYGRKKPLVNACRPPGEWQTYDIIFHRPIFDENGKVTRRATFTVLHNGVLVQDHTVLFGGTGWNGPHAATEYVAHADKLPLSLQDHGHPVRFRNIWIRELAD